MKTTIDIPDPLLRKAREVARKEGTTLKMLVSEGLQARLSRKDRGEVSYAWEPITTDSELREGIDIAERDTYRDLIHRPPGR